MTELGSDILAQAAVWRAAAEVRRGWPVLIECQGEPPMVLSALERLQPRMLALADHLSASTDLLLTANRASTLKVAAKGWPVVRLQRANWLDAADMAAIADPSLDMGTPLKGPFQRIDEEPTQAHEAAIKLLKVAGLLPAGLVGALTRAESASGLIGISVDALSGFDTHEAENLQIVARARLPVAGAEESEIFAFRPAGGGLEHMALVIGQPNRREPVLARLHSECFTGDLLHSMKCDCGDQLKGAVGAIARAGGGVILYLAQEGRGIGLISKLKAYSLQDQGYDTVDANTRLGFDVDERLFAPAAIMLQRLGIDAVRLMTNNPEKVEALERYGIDVAERVQHAFEPNPHNEQYLAVKKARTGHLL